MDAVEQRREGKGYLSEGVWISLTNPESPVVLESALGNDRPHFEPFQHAILANPLVYEVGLRYRGLGEAREITFLADRSRPPPVNGKPTDWQMRKVYDCPPSGPSGVAAS